MKLIVALAGIGWLWVGPLAAQSVFTGGVEIHRGAGDDQSSKVYEMKGPYVLQWDLMDVKPPVSKDPYWKPRTDSSRNPPWISIRVVDAVTRKQVYHESPTGRMNHMVVPQGGRHYLVVTSYSDLSWIIRGKEGKLTPEGRDSKLTPLTAADVGGGTAESAAAAMIGKFRSELKGKDLETRIEAVKLVASRSSSAKDFAERFRAYGTAQGW